MSSKLIELVTNPLLWTSIAVSIAPFAIYLLLNQSSLSPYERKKQEYYSFISRGLLGDIECDRCKTIIGEVCEEFKDADKIRCINTLKKLLKEKNWEKELKELSGEQKKELVKKIREDLEKLSKERGLKFE